jgi:hypothetical protein
MAIWPSIADTPGRPSIRNPAPARTCKRLSRKFASPPFTYTSYIRLIAHLREIISIIAWVIQWLWIFSFAFLAREKPLDHHRHHRHHPCAQFVGQPYNG